MRQALSPDSLAHSGAGGRTGNSASVAGPKPTLLRRASGEGPGATLWPHTTSPEVPESRTSHSRAQDASVGAPGDAPGPPRPSVARQTRSSSKRAQSGSKRSMRCSMPRAAATSAATLRSAQSGSPKVPALSPPGAEAAAAAATARESRPPDSGIRGLLHPTTAASTAVQSRVHRQSARASKPASSWGRRAGAGSSQRGSPSSRSGRRLRGPTSEP